MAVDTPVLERVADEKSARSFRSVPARMDVVAEEEHNARIRERYSRLINPENKIEDVFGGAREEQSEVYEQPAVQQISFAAVQPAPVLSRPYQVENARADSILFRADSAINSVANQAVAEQEVAAAQPAVEEESEDSMPTPTTIQYQTVASAKEQKKASYATDKRAGTFGKREKIIVAIFVAVVVALLVLVVVNATVIANLNTEISNVQENITTVKGALAGVNSTVVDIIHNSVGN